jgi:hypothetical protein
VHRSAYRRATTALRAWPSNCYRSNPLRFSCVLWLLAACAAEPSDRPATWAYIHAAIIAPACATSSCHSALAATAGVVLDDPDVGYTILLDRQYVIPGDPTSALSSLLAGDERPRMPPDAPLTTGDIALVNAWIADGAPR